MPRQRSYAKCGSERCCRQVETSNLFEYSWGERREEPTRSEGEGELRRQDVAAARARKGPTANFWTRRGETPGKHAWRDAGAARAEAAGPRAGGVRIREIEALLQRSTTWE
ncbi:unnamed protein product [Prorocentrum cordatum]|uniref:Uncharacterized protein n=1 Tax=Prorocentrum cordatum TaxID=2364126 RepID=A0ABN9VHR5_9DINO|nr:unnamed protein product [Polarella glacialis]